MTNAPARISMDSAVPTPSPSSVDLIALEKELERVNLELTAIRKERDKQRQQLDQLQEENDQLVHQREQRIKRNQLNSQLQDMEKSVRRKTARRQRALEDLELCKTRHRQLQRTLDLLQGGVQSIVARSHRNAAAVLAVDDDDNNNKDISSSSIKNNNNNIRLSSSWQTSASGTSLSVTSSTLADARLRAAQREELLKSLMSEDLIIKLLTPGQSHSAYCHSSGEIPHADMLQKAGADDDEDDDIHDDYVPVLFADKNTRIDSVDSQMSAPDVIIQGAVSSVQHVSQQDYLQYHQESKAAASATDFAPLRLQTGSSGEEGNHVVMVRSQAALAVDLGGADAADGVTRSNRSSRRTARSKDRSSTRSRSTTSREKGNEGDDSSPAGCDRSSRNRDRSHSRDRSTGSANSTSRRSTSRSKSRSRKGRRPTKNGSSKTTTGDNNSALANMLESSRNDRSGSDEDNQSDDDTPKTNNTADGA